MGSRGYVEVILLTIGRKFVFPRFFLAVITFREISQVFNGTQNNSKVLYLGTFQLVIQVSEGREDGI